jgi:hypothetical protein
MAARSPLRKRGRLHEDIGMAPELRVDEGSFAIFSEGVSGKPWRSAARILADETNVFWPTRTQQMNASQHQPLMQKSAATESVAGPQTPPAKFLPKRTHRTR